MHYLGASITAPGPATGPRDESMLGEPTPEFTERTTTDVLRTLDGQLQDVDVVRVIDRHWLASDLLNREFDEFLASFIARGGRVEFVDGATHDGS
jgi:hypothetical protein